MVKHSIASVLGFGLVLLLISGCSSTPQKIQVSASPIEKPQLTLPNVDELSMKEVTWVIITEENYEKVFADLKKSGRPLAIFGVTDKGYAHLGENLSAIRALIQQQQTIIAAYETYYKNAEDALDNANKQVNSVNDEVNELNNNTDNESKWRKFNPFN